MDGHLLESEYDQMYRRDVYLSYNVIKRDGGPFIFRVRICSSNMQEGCLFELCDQM